MQSASVCPGPFRGQNVLSLDIAVYKLNDGFIIIQVQNDHGHGILPGLFAGMFPPVTGDQLIAAFHAGSGNGRDKDTILADAFL